MTTHAWPVLIAPLGTRDVDVDGLWTPAYLVREGRDPDLIDEGWIALCRSCNTAVDLGAVHANKLDARHWFAWHAVATGHRRMWPIKVMVRS